MAILFVDSFDHYDDITQKWDARSDLVEETLGNNVDISTVEGRFVPGSLEVKNNVFGQNGTVKNFVETDEIIVGFAWYNKNSDSYDSQHFIENTAGDLQGFFEINSDTGVAVLDCESAHLETATLLFTGGVWQHVEMRIKRHATLGELEIRRNGVTVGLSVGLDTLGNSTTGFQKFIARSTNYAQRHYIDDFYIADTTGPAPQNTFIGDSRITVLRPKANGLDNNFVAAGAATNWEAVDDALADDDTSYVESGQVGAKEAYTNKDFDELGIAPGTIFTAQVVNSSRKTDAGTIKYKDQFIIGGLTYDDVEVTATSGDYHMTMYVRDTDPSDGLTWTEEKIAATGSGLEITFKVV